MVITKKDKKLLLLITSIIIVFWFFCLSISSIFSNINHTPNINKLTNTKAEWLNSSRNITSNDLKNRIILIDFWTHSCINCLYILPEIKKLEEEFGKKLTIISVHSGKIDNDRQTTSVKNAILKYNINHLTVNDVSSTIQQNFKIDSLPTIILLDIKGKIIKKYQDKISQSSIKKDIKKLIKKYNYQLNNDKLPILLEKNKMVNYVLKFPSDIEYARNFSNKNIIKTNSLIISNTSKNTILVTSFKGKTLLEIGSGKSGFDDGDIATASFNSPRGLLFKNDTLYIADTGNHLLRKVNFQTNQVTTIAGTGIKGLPITTTEKSTKTNLASPWDLEFFPDNKNIIISNAGTNQLLQYNITDDTIKPFAGNGTEGLIDGKYPNNSLAQPSGLSTSLGKLYFIDSKTSSLRVIDKNNTITTLIGKSLFDFGYNNGNKKNALMQHPVGINADDTGIYITDTYNHLIRKYDLKTKKLSNYSGKIIGNKIGDTTSYNEPEAIISVLNKFYIVDTGNNRIIELNRNNKKSKLLNIIPQPKTPKEGLSEYLPNLQIIPTTKVKNNSKINLLFDMKKGWKFNKSAPSFFNLIKIENNQEANLITSFNSDTIESGMVLLPKLSKNYIYYLQGTLYYCQDIPNSICLIKSYEQKLIPTKHGSNKIKIQFIYQ